jgi:hypothetical protein
VETDGLVLSQHPVALLASSHIFISLQNMKGFIRMPRLITKTKPNKLQVRITGTKSFSDAAHDTAEVVRLSDHAIIPSLA